MSATSEFSGILHRTLAQPARGVVGLVDDLLALCPEHGLHLEWQTGHCRVRSYGGDGEEPTDVPLGQSVFRAILARVAALCNERSPSSVSPYGGQGELSVGANPPAVFRVTFANTPDEHKLELI